MITLPDVVAVQHTAVSTGDLVLLGEIRSDDHDSLVWAGEETVRITSLGPHDAGHSYPSLLAHPASGVVVVRDLTHAGSGCPLHRGRRLRDPDRRVPVRWSPDGAAAGRRRGADAIVPSGLAKAEILDHHPARGWWLRLDDDVTVVPSLV